MLVNFFLTKPPHPLLKSSIDRKNEWLLAVTSKPHTMYACRWQIGLLTVSGSESVNLIAAKGHSPGTDKGKEVTNTFWLVCQRNSNMIHQQALARERGRAGPILLLPAGLAGSSRTSPALPTFSDLPSQLGD